MECGGEAHLVRALSLPDMVNGGEPHHVCASNLLDVAHISSWEVDEEDQGVGIRPKSSPLPRRRDSCSSDDFDQGPPPSQSRRVSFADTFGLSLVSVKEFDTWSSLILPALSYLEVDSETQLQYILSCLFSVPSSETELVQKLQDTKIVLEGIELLPGSTTLRGIIRVLNFCFDKTVYVRTTLDSWISHFDLLAEYMSGSSDGETDRFSFRLTLVPPFSPAGARVEFCLRYETPVGTFWANNNGSNYILFCGKRGEIKDTQLEEVHHRTRRSCLKSVSKELCTEASPTIHPDEDRGSHFPDAPKEEAPRKTVDIECSKECPEDDHHKSLVESKQGRRRRRVARLAQIPDHFSQRDTAVQSWNDELNLSEDINGTVTPYQENSSCLSGTTDTGIGEDINGTVTPYQESSSCLSGGTDTGFGEDINGTVTPYQESSSCLSGGTDTGIHEDISRTVTPYRKNSSCLSEGTDTGKGEEVRETVTPYHENSSRVSGGTETGVDQDINKTVTPYHENSSHVSAGTETGVGKDVNDRVTLYHGNSSCLSGGTETGVCGEDKETEKQYQENSSSFLGGTGIRGPATLYQENSSCLSEGIATRYQENSSCLSGGTATRYQENSSCLSGGTATLYQENSSCLSGGTATCIDEHNKTTATSCNYNISHLSGRAKTVMGEDIRGSTTPYHESSLCLSERVKTGVDEEVSERVTPGQRNTSPVSEGTESIIGEDVRGLATPYHENSSSLLGVTESLVTGENIRVIITPCYESNLSLSRETEPVMGEKFRETVTFYHENSLAASDRTENEHLTSRQRAMAYEHSFPMSFEADSNSQPTIIPGATDWKEGDHRHMDDTLHEPTQPGGCAVQECRLSETRTGAEGADTAAHMVPREQPTALQRPPRIGALFDGAVTSQSGTVSKLISTAAQKTLSKWDTNMWQYSRTSVTSNISMVSHSKVMGASSGEWATVETEPPSGSHTTSNHQPFMFHTFVAPLYHQAFHRVGTESCDIDTGENEEDEEMEEEAQSHDSADTNKILASADYYGHYTDTGKAWLWTPTDGLAPVDKPPNLEEKFPEVSASQITLNACVEKENETVGSDNKNSVPSIQAAAFLCLGCQKAEKTSFEGIGSDNGDRSTEVSCSSQAAEHVKYSTEAKGDSFAVVLKPVNSSSESRALREESGDSTLSLYTDGKTESTVNKPMGIFTDHSEENPDEDMSTVKDERKEETSLGKTDEEMKEELVGENEERGKEECTAFREIIKAHDIEDYVGFSHEIEILNKQLITAKGDFLVQDKRDTLIGKFRKAFSESEHDISMGKEYLITEKAFKGAEENILIDMKDGSCEKEAVSVKSKSLEEGDKVVIREDAFTRTMQNVTDAAEESCGGKDRTERHYCPEEETTNRNKLSKGEEEERRGEVFGEHKQTVYKAEAAHVDKGHDIVKEQKGCWTQWGEEKYNIYKETSNIGSKHGKKDEHGREFLCSREVVVNYKQKYEALDTINIFTVRKDNVKTGGKEGEGDAIVWDVAHLPVTQQLVYRGKDEEHVKEKAEDEGRVSAECKVHTCEEGEDLHTERQVGDHAFREEAGDVKEGEEELDDDMETCASEEDEERSTSTDSLTDDELEQYLLGVKAVQSPPRKSTAPHEDALARASKRVPANQGTALSSITEFPEEEDQPQVELSMLKGTGSPAPATPPPVEEAERTRRSRLLWRNDSSSGDASEAIFYAVLLVIFLVTAYHYDLIACFALYLFSVFCLCCHGEKHGLQRKGRIP